MISDQGMSYEQKKQALLGHFLPYQKQDINCSRIVEYLQSSQTTRERIERMRTRLVKIREERAQQYVSNVEHIRFSAEEQSVHDREEAEQLLMSW